LRGFRKSIVPRPNADERRRVAMSRRSVLSGDVASFSWAATLTAW
jgi:hypothetical protein